MSPFSKAPDVNSRHNRDHEVKKNDQDFEESNQLSASDRDQKKNSNSITNGSNIEVSLPNKPSNITNNYSNSDHTNITDKEVKIKNEVNEINLPLNNVQLNQPNQSNQPNQLNHPITIPTITINPAISVNLRQSNEESSGDKENRGVSEKMSLQQSVSPSRLLGSDYSVRVKSVETDDKELNFDSVTSGDIDWQLVLDRSGRSSAKNFEERIANQENLLLLSKEKEKKNTMNNLNLNTINENDEVKDNNFKDSNKKQKNSDDSIYSKDEFLVSGGVEVDPIEDDILNYVKTTPILSGNRNENDNNNESRDSINNIQMSPMNLIIDNQNQNQILENNKLNIPLFSDYDEDKDENNLHISIEKNNENQIDIEEYTNDIYDTKPSGGKILKNSAGSGDLIKINDGNELSARSLRNESLPKKNDGNNRYNNLEEQNSNPDYYKNKPTDIIDLNENIKPELIPVVYDETTLKLADEITNSIMNTIFQTEIFSVSHLIPQKNFKAMASSNNLNESTNSLSNSANLSYLPNGQSNY